MNDKEPRDSFLLRLWRFIGERSFYFILLLCMLVIGGTAWIFSSALDSTKPVEPSLQHRASSPPRTPDPGAVYTWMPEIVPPQQATPELTEAPAEEPEAGAEAAELPPEEAAEVIATAFGWPIKGDICSGYSVDRLQYDRTMQDWRTHNAIDIEAVGVVRGVCLVAFGMDSTLDIELIIVQAAGIWHNPIVMAHIYASQHFLPRDQGLVELLAMTRSDDFTFGFPEDLHNALG